MQGELIGEFKGKNTVYRVLPYGKMEVQALEQVSSSAQMLSLLLRALEQSRMVYLAVKSMLL